MHPLATACLFCPVCNPVLLGCVLLNEEALAKAEALLLADLNSVVRGHVPEVGAPLEEATLWAETRFNTIAHFFFIEKKNLPVAAIDTGLSS